MRTGKRTGSTLLEFSLVGVPLILISVSILRMSIAMWQFYTCSTQFSRPAGTL